MLRPVMSDVQAGKVGWPPSWALTMVGIAGAVLWFATAAIADRREAWDSSLYWTYTYPFGVVLAGFFGYFVIAPNAWLFGVVLMLAQAVALAVTAASFGLLPLGLILFGVLSIPAAVMAGAGAWMRRLGENRRAS